MKINHPRRMLRAWLLAGAATVIAPAPVALADTPSGAQDQTAQVGEVVVTAERTKENILNVGVNVSVVSDKLLQQSRISSPTDLATLIPNLDVKTNIPGAQQIITVRGVGYALREQ